MIKRKIGYDDEVRAAMRLKMGEMVIDDNNSEQHHDDME